ncbi:hypothetical protein, partial [Streptomyces sp. IBSBF 2435]|uniref:hypothetical protein n=1 Tax=Streptomyces sp. IBSBF 2435 TaxID=2903531 RepID=UPI002FDBE3BF
MSQQTTEPRPGDGTADPADSASRPGRRRRRRLLPWKHRRDLAPEQLRRRKMVTRGLTGVCLVCVGTAGWSVGQALTYPGKDSTAARLAEWARDHELGFVVDKLEDMQYSMNPPKVGGTLSTDALARMKATQGAVPTPA